MSEVECAIAMNQSYEDGRRETLSSIAHALKYTYEDFDECANDAMDIELGEVLRAKLECIRKILRREGVEI